MKFDSLSEAVKYYSSDSSELFSGASPFGSFGAQLNIVPPTTNYLQPTPQNVMVYGQTIWGESIIINQSKPES